jgi:DNA polymerase-1
MSNGKYLSILEQIKKHGGKVDSGSPNDKVLIIDGLNTFIRVFSVMPTLNDDGVHIGGIVGFLKSVGYAIKTLRPTRCVIVFDGKGGSIRRRKIFPEYKNKKRVSYRVNRSNDFASVDDERQNMIMQLQRSVEYLNMLPLTVLSMDYIEADDAIAYTSRQVLKESNIIIMSTDKDFLQLVDDRTSIWSPIRKKLYNPEKVKEDYTIPPNNFLLYRILDGDKSDNIPGVKGVGLKTLIKNIPDILDETKILTIEEIINFSKFGGSKMYEAIVDSKDQIYINEKLMQLSNVNISASAKMKIRNTINNPIQRLVKVKFQKMFLEDKLYSAMPNLNSWLAITFNRLNQMAEKTHG